MRLLLERPMPKVGDVFWLLRTGEHYPEFRRCEVRAVVDDENIVFRSWVGLRRGWFYQMEDVIWWHVRTMKRPAMGPPTLCFSREEANRAEQEFRRRQAAERERREA